MNSKNHPTFPYRRGAGKRRGKGVVNNNPNGRRGGGGGGPRRPPGSAAELLPMLQPTTKALAQMLAGNTRASGQLVHARKMLEQAQRLIDERAMDRMQPSMREEFLEQVARLKLTLADAVDLEIEQDELDQEEEAPQAPPVTMDRLRELALSLSGPAPEIPVKGPQVPDEQEEPVEAAAPQPAAARESVLAEEDAAEPQGVNGKTRKKLRLKTVVSLPGNQGS